MSLTERIRRVNQSRLDQFEKDKDKHSLKIWEHQFKTIEKLEQIYRSGFALQSNKYEVIIYDVFVQLNELNPRFVNQFKSHLVIENIPGDVRDEDLSILAGVYGANLIECFSITPKGLSYFKGSKILFLDECGGVTDQGLKNIAGVFDEIRLNYCDNITDQGLKYIKGSKKVDLTGCYQVTDTGLQYFEDAEDITFLKADKITDQGLYHLRKVKEIQIASNSITDTGLRHLGNAESITISGDNITNRGMKHLIKVNKVYLGNCKVTERGIILLQLHGCVVKLLPGYNSLRNSGI